MAGEKLPKEKGTFFISINDKSKENLLDELKILSQMGFNLLSTEGTHQFLSKNGILSSKINKIHDSYFPNILDFIREKKIDIIINTPLSRVSQDDSFAIRQQAIKSKVTCITTDKAAKCFINGIKQMKTQTFNLFKLQN